MAWTKSRVWWDHSWHKTRSWKADIILKRFKQSSAGGVIYQPVYSGYYLFPVKRLLSWWEAPSEQFQSSVLNLAEHPIKLSAAHYVLIELHKRISNIIATDVKIIQRKNPTNGIIKALVNAAINGASNWSPFYSRDHPKNSLLRQWTDGFLLNSAYFFLMSIDTFGRVISTRVTGT